MIVYPFKREQLFLYSRLCLKGFEPRPTDPTTALPTELQMHAYLKLERNCHFLHLERTVIIFDIHKNYCSNGVVFRLSKKWKDDSSVYFTQDEEFLLIFERRFSRFKKDF